MIRNITRETVPCWYEFGWRKRKKKLIMVLRINRRHAEDFSRIPPEAPIVKDFKRGFGFKEFAVSFRGDLGFESVLKLLRVRGEFFEYEVPTPLCRKISGRCPHCRGSGNDELLHRECLYCDGGGKKIVYDYREAYAVSASLTVFLMVMAYPETETTASVPQLLTCETVTARDIHGGSLHGHYSRELVQYLRLRGLGPVPEMVTAMKIVWRRMAGKIRKFDEFNFSARVDHASGWLNVSCPGNAAGLNPDSNYRQSGEGYGFGCHNVDTVMQQLTLLASLAALHDLARKSRGEAVV